MVQKKKLKRVDPGSTEAQIARGAKITSHKFEPTAFASTRQPNFPSVARAQQAAQGGFPLRQGSLEELRAQPQPQLPQDSREFWARAKEAGFGETLRRGLDVGREEVPHETPSNLDLALATVGASGIARAAAKPTTFSTQAGRLLTSKEATRAKTINKIALRSGVDRHVISRYVHIKAVKNEIDILLNSSPNKFAKAIGKLGLKGTAALIGATTLITWYALDNIIGGQKFYLKDVRSGLEDGSISPEAAREALLESITAVETAQKFATKSAELNPAFYPVQKVIKQGVKADEAAIELTINQIESLITGQQAQVEQEAKFPEPASFEEYVQQQEFIRRANK